MKQDIRLYRDSLIYKHRFVNTFPDIASSVLSIVYSEPRFNLYVLPVLMAQKEVVLKDWFHTYIKWCIICFKGLISYIKWCTLCHKRSTRNSNGVPYILTGMFQKLNDELYIDKVLVS